MMSWRRLACAVLALVFALAGPVARADNFSPAYLELTERAPGLYAVRWKTPAQSEVSVQPIRPVFPPGSVMTRPFASSFAANAVVMLGEVRVPGGVEGKTVRFDGLAEAGNQALVRLVRRDGAEDLYTVAPTEPRLAIPAQPTSLGVSTRYARLGIAHIWFGFDHLLFVAALFMLVANLRALVWTVTSFTLAHSITLALVTLDVVSVPVPPVEAFIALSIVFVAVEVLRQARGRPTLAARKPWLVAFVFGLLHGLGFASALAQIGLPHGNVPLALLFFNVGVEIGQVAFVAALLGAAILARRFARQEQIGMARLVSCYAIGGLASYWFFDRVAGF